MSLSKNDVKHRKTQEPINYVRHFISDNSISLAIEQIIIVSNCSLYVSSKWKFMSILKQISEGEGAGKQLLGQAPTIWKTLSCKQSCENGRKLWTVSVQKLSAFGYF